MLYAVEVDGVSSDVEAQSLAGVANKIRGTGQHIKIWQKASGIQLVDTKFGDAYNLVNKPALKCKVCGAEAYPTPTGWQCVAYSNHRS